MLDLLRSKRKIMTFFIYLSFGASQVYNI